jgi:hypothetical protein
MVLSNASKNARLSNTIINRNNTCGGNGKAGLASSVGPRIPFKNRLTRAKQTQYNDVCLWAPRTTEVQRSRARAAISGSGMM